MSGAELDQRTSALASELVAMSGPSVERSVLVAEAEQIARICVVEGERFAQENSAVRPAWWNNCLTNTGFKRWGLCWHYEHYLFGALHPLSLKYYHVHNAVRDKVRKFHEHHCIVIVRNGGSFRDGIVIDPWKEGGRTIWFATHGDQGEWLDQERTRRRLTALLQELEWVSEQGGSRSHLEGIESPLMDDAGSR